jgi:hypothetical protein
LYEVIEGKFDSVRSAIFAGYWKIKEAFSMKMYTLTAAIALTVATMGYTGAASAQRALSHGALGAGIGALVGGGKGAAIGGIVGVGVGAGRDQAEADRRQQQQIRTQQHQQQMQQMDYERRVMEAEQRAYDAERRAAQ